MGVVLTSKATAVQAVVCALLGTSSATGQLNPVGPAEVCTDFSADRYAGLTWSFDDCIDVWNHFEGTIGYNPYHPEVGMWRETALELRQKGSPCMLGSIAGGDGLGSTTIRHVATWIFAEEMGCDWMTPDWGKKKLEGSDGELVRYCHAIVPRDERRSPENAGGMKGLSRCTVVDWLSYFQFDKSSVSWPSSGSVKIVNQTTQEPEKGYLVAGIVSAKEDLKLERAGSADRGWEHVVFQIGLAAGSHHILNPRSWDHSKRAIVRNILGQMRENFHRHPRRWYDDNPHCLYDPSRLHFAMHVRMGDRHKFTDKHPEYFERLEEVMSTISLEVVRKGLPEPMFHIFSETIMPCPSERTGLFDEFPAWPVAADQVAACPGTVEHDGIFGVHDKAITLHFDRDVQTAMTCMIQADGIVMGCSTFGQIAGLFSNGISMFSTQCGGERTPPQYRMIPPLAVSERGHLWVPVVGSWFDPILQATHIFRSALDVLLDTTSRHSRLSRVKSL